MECNFDKNNGGNAIPISQVSRPTKLQCKMDLSDFWWSKITHNPSIGV